MENDDRADGLAYEHPFIAESIYIISFRNTRLMNNKAVCPNEIFCFPLSVFPYITLIYLVLSADRVL